MDRPLAATVLPLLFFAGALGAGWTFEARQRAEGTPALHAAGKALEPAIESRLPGAQVQLESVEVHGDEGRTTYWIRMPGETPRTMRVAEQAFRWRRAPDGSWVDPQGVDRPRFPTRPGGR